VTAILAFSDIYLDTSIAAAAISSGDPHSAACMAFCAHLAQDNTTVYFSQLLRLEIAQFIRKLATALQAGLNDLATVDGKFARVSGLNVHIVR